MKKTIVILLILIFAIYATAETVTSEGDLTKGSRGEEVIALQEKLNATGYSVGKADGDFGGKTEKAVKEFQKDHGLDENGIVDESFMELLDKEYEIIRLLESVYNHSNNSTIGAKKERFTVYESLLKRLFGSMFGLYGDYGNISIEKKYDSVSEQMGIYLTDETFPYGWLLVKEKGKLSIGYRAKDYSKGVAILQDMMSSGGGSFMSAFIQGCAENGVYENVTFVNKTKGMVHYYNASGRSMSIGSNAYSSYDTLSEICAIIEKEA